MPYALRVLSGPGEGELHPLLDGRTVLLGREPTSHIVIPDKGASRFHCQIAAAKGSCRLNDLQSTNGTFVNGARASECDLKFGDTIKIGQTLLRVEESEDEGHPPTAARTT